MSNNCKVCLKPHNHCTCVGAEKKHAEHVNRVNLAKAPVDAPVAAPVSIRINVPEHDIIHSNEVSQKNVEADHKPLKKKGRFSK